MQESLRRLDVEEVVLYDTDRPRTEVVARICREVVRVNGGGLRVRIAATAEDAVDGASFVLNSVRVGRHCEPGRG